MAATIDKQVLCPSCGKQGRAVKPVTIESLVVERARRRLNRTDGLRFCAEPACELAYFHPGTGDRLLRSDVKVRIGQKETTPPRPVCYCFGYTVEQIDDQVRETGRSGIADDITEKCRQGLDRCEETNPQGACCLGNARRALKAAQAKFGPRTPMAAGTPENSDAVEVDCCALGSTRERRSTSRLDAGTVAQFGALASAIVSSACCWLPLLLIVVGVSGGALASTFEAWRPILLPVTFVLLGIAFYLTYRGPKVSTASAAGSNMSGDACCALTEPGPLETCCPPATTKGMTFKNVNKAMLWVVTAFVLAFAFFPNHVGQLLGGDDSRAARDDLDKVIVEIDGMTCEGCALTIEKAILAVPGVEGARVLYPKGEARITLGRTSPASTEAIVAAVERAGYEATLARSDR